MSASNMEFMNHTDGMAVIGNENLASPYSRLNAIESAGGRTITKPTTASEIEYLH